VSRIRYKKRAVWVSVLLLVSSGAQAGGLNIKEIGTPDVGMASAGRAALAEDASTVQGNPAGMARLERNQAMGALQALFIGSDFDVDPSATTFGSRGGDLDDEVFIPSGAYVHTLGDDWRLGTSLGATLGGALDYPSTWAGRYFVTRVDLLTVTATGGASYRINDKLSVGAMLRTVFAKLEQKAAINNPVQPDGRLKYEDDDLALGGSFGVLYEPTDRWRLGLRYRTRVKLEFRDRPSLDGLGPALTAALQLSGLAGASAKIEMELPQDLLFSVYHQLSERTELTMNLGWENWHRFGKSDITLSSATTTSFTRDLDYDNTWHVAVGSRYRLNPRWRVSAGFAYDSSPVGRSDRTPDLPLDRQVRIATGALYDLNESVVLGASYVYVDLGDADIRQSGGLLTGSLAGDYSPNRIHAVNVNVTWRF
jgi:long-chain fatty acid transport protein